MCVVASIVHDLPNKFVESQKIRDWLKYLNLDFVAITRNTAKADVMDMFKREKENLNIELTNIPTTVSLTSYLWTPCTT